jgi:hypothetical protein
VGGVLIYWTVDTTGSMAVHSQLIVVLKMPTKVAFMVPKEIRAKSGGVAGEVSATSARCRDESSERVSAAELDGSYRW